MLVSFEDLLGATSTVDFMTKHWETTPAVLRPTRDMAGLFALSDVEAAVLAASASSSNPAPYAVRSGLDGTEEYSLARDVSGTPTMGSVYGAFHAGYTIVADHVARFLPKVAGLCASAESHLQHPVGCNMFLTPANAQGFVPHYDAMDTFFIQIDGSKQWSVWAPHVEFPFGSGFDKPDASSLGPPVFTVDLQAGEVLYLPRGWIHAGQTSERLSLHLTLGVTTWRWLDLLKAKIDQLAQADERLRRSVPLSRHLGISRDSLEQEVSDLLAEVMSHRESSDGSGALDDMIASTLGQRRSNAIAHLESTFTTSVSPESILERRDGLQPVVTRRGELAVLHFAGGFVEGPREATRALVFVAETNRFSVAELPGLHLANQQALAMALIAEGLARLVRP